MYHAHILRRALAAALCCTFVAFGSSGALAQAVGATVAGIIIDQQGGLPIPNASIELVQGKTALAKTTTGKDGRFSFADQAPGIYGIVVTAAGFTQTRSSDITVAPNAATVTTNLAIARTNASLPTIGEVTTANPSTSLQTSTTITRSVSPTLLEKEGFNRLAEGLGLLPGVNMHGQGSNVGDDVYPDIRGLKPSETQTLIDGHPAGPIGVNASLSSGGYDYLASPLVGLRNVQVTYGAGAVGLYGTDSAGGTIDWQTLNPTTKPTFSLAQSYGTFFHQSTTAVASGSAGPLGWVLAHGVTGTQGVFNGSPQLQSGLLGSNLTSGNYAKYTYPVGSSMVLRSDLGKLTYTFGPVTQLTLTAFANNAWEDKTGTGNNFTPYLTQYYNTIKSLPKTGPCPDAVQVTTDAGKQCMDPGTYASLTSGPAGTGVGRYTTETDQDFHARLTTQIVGGVVTLDSFENTYSYNNPTPISQTASTPTYQTDTYHTFGFLASDDYQFANNEFGFGWYLQHQLYQGIRNNPVDWNNPYSTPIATIGTSNFFVRDVWSVSHALQFFANVWFKNSNSTEASVTTVDPRLTVVVRPDAADVIRLTGGKSVGLPDPTQGIGSGIRNPGSLNPVCTNVTPGVNGVGSVGTPGVSGLKPETSVDFEAAYGHRFQNGTLVQADYYNSAVSNPLFTTSLNASLLPPGSIPAPVLQALYNRVYNYSAACAGLVGAYDPADFVKDLQVSIPTNAGNGLFRGIELSVTHPVTKDLTFNAYWDVQNAEYTNIPSVLLQQNVTLLDGGQIFGIPLQKQGVAFDYAGGNGFAGHIDATRFGSYNQWDTQPFIVVNGFVSKQYGRFTVTVGGTNLFDTHDWTYAMSGVGVFVPENQYGKDTTPLSQGANKARAYQPRQIMGTISVRF